ncbi:SDR family oxidoreductase [Tunturiibacter empetritectus]|uniref:3-oxoacyl-[acyl-carrier protein] reductase n=2 Tax=Tunturiibacter TaxID=3154218 RepID=A0A852VH47_9BACT|nr:SDR family oxidoreductase [Edaphobacter lichenicola]NYF92148.1 3-oxoacyl-[acyl-carrier protein] reductase [Edaphobacter lichenicola]
MLSSGGSGVTMSLAGRVALITGGSRGIGAATVRMFRQAGAKVVFNYRSATKEAEAIVAECGGAAVCRAVEQTLSTPEDGAALVRAAVAAFGRVDCAILNHGVWPAHDAPIAEMTSEQWRSTMGTNLDSVFGVVRTAVAQMKIQPKAQAQVGSARGHIVLISSTAGQRGEAFHVDYAATKGALISLTKSLSTELIGEGIYCNCVAPGWVATDASAGVLSDPVVSKKLLSLIPLGRPAHVDEIAAPVLFLCTPFAGFISGEIFNVNGGAVLVG